MRFALVGKIDVNRDSRDDRAELKRMIQEAGGVVDFDLPPADLGKETGVAHRRASTGTSPTTGPAPRYVLASKDASVEVAQETLNKRVGDVIKEARLNGIRPMTIERAPRLPRLRHEYAGPRPYGSGQCRRHAAPHVAPACYRYDQAGSARW